MKRILILAILVLSSPCVWAASKASDVKQGNSLYNQQKYAQALEKYNSALDRAPESPIINFNAGAALYKNGEYEKAISHFEKSLLSDDPKLQAKGHYNLGNTFYKLGKNKESSQLTVAVKLLEDSKSHLEKALQLNPNDQDVKFNLGVVQKELEKIEEKKRYQKGQPGPSDKNQEIQKFQEDKDSENLVANPQSDNAKDKIYQEDDHFAEKIIDQTKKDNKSQTENSEKNQSEEKSVELIVKPGELSPQEAQMLLDNYSQNEEPKSLLNLRLQKQGNAAPVLKDW